MRLIDTAGSVASISSLVIALYYQWHGDAITQRNIAIFTGLLFIAVIAIAHVRKSKSKQLGGNLVAQSGEFKISERRDSQIDIYYPEPFSNPPNLELLCSKGHLELTVLEQRADGFRFKAGSGYYDSIEGCYVAWKAKGVLKKKD